MSKETFPKRSHLAQNFFNYFLLFFVYGLIIACRSGEDRNMLNVLKARGWKYLVLAFVDVQANYFIVYAYQFTNLTSVQVSSTIQASCKQKVFGCFRFLTAL